jgi:pimeloyl-ACP methyl ester carboxylesterase
MLVNTFRRAYMTTGVLKTQLHYRIGGKGKPLVLLHPSPRSGKMLETFGQYLIKHYQVIIPDLYGYGQSDPLPIPPKKLGDYILYLEKALIKITKGEKFAVYGSATGAQLAVRYGLDKPEHLSHVFLDNAAHFSDSERHEILSRYFPSFSPNPDGSHLAKLWEHIVLGSQYFPWYDKTKPLNMPTAPPSVLTGILTDYLIAGEDYDLAYRLAFQHERAQYIQSLGVDTLIFKWLQSPLLPYIEKLLAHSFPSHIQVKEINGSERFAQMAAAIQAVY